VGHEEACEAPPDNARVCVRGVPHRVSLWGGRLYRLVGLLASESMPPHKASRCQATTDFAVRLERMTRRSLPYTSWGPRWRWPVQPARAAAQPFPCLQAGSGIVRAAMMCFLCWDGNLHMRMQREDALFCIYLSRDTPRKGSIFLTEEGLVWCADGTLL
jgi:hypothetical protein